MRPVILLLPLACLSTAACQLPRPIDEKAYTDPCPISEQQPAANALLFVTLRVPDCRKPDLVMSAYRASGPWYGAADDDLRVTFYHEEPWHEAAAARLRASSGPPVVFIHGFNNDNRFALGRALAIRDLVKDRPVIAFTWPSYASKSRYIWDEANAEWSGVTARELIKKLASSAPKIMVVAHSMGNRIALETVKSLQAPGGPKPVERLVMASPDVDRETVERELRAPGGIGTKVTIYGSRRDQPLSTSWRVHGLPRAGDLSAWVTGSVAAYGHFADLTDVDVIDTTDVRADRLGHDDFISTRQGAADLCRVLNGQKPDDGREKVAENVFKLRVIPPQDECTEDANDALTTLNRLKI